MGECTLINILQAQEFSGGPVSWTWHYHPGGPGLTCGWGIKILQDVGVSRVKTKEKKEKKRNKLTPRQVTKTKQRGTTTNNTPHTKRRDKMDKPNPRQMIKNKNK